MPEMDIAPDALGRQALKSRRTRELLIQSAVTLIRRGGIAAASAKRIAEHAGMTWGAAQHHFGSKEKVFEAILAQSHDAFRRRFTGMGASAPLGERIETFVGEMWEHYRSDLYLATIEVVMADRAAENIRLSTFDWPNADHLDLMTRVFGDCGLSPDDLLEALIFTHCALTGLSIQALLEGDLGREAGHLRRCMRVMESMLS